MPPGRQALLLFSYYVGLGVHRKSISFCVKQADGTIVKQGRILATREAIGEWAATLDGLGVGGWKQQSADWIYHELKQYAARVEMGNPSRPKAISAAKRKNDALDAPALADLLRSNLFPARYVPPIQNESSRYLRFIPPRRVARPELNLSLVFVRILGFEYEQPVDMVYGVRNDGVISSSVIREYPSWPVQVGQLCPAWTCSTGLFRNARATIALASRR